MIKHDYQILIAGHADDLARLVKHSHLHAVLREDPEHARVCVGSAPACALSDALDVLTLVELEVPVLGLSVVVEGAEEHVGCLLVQLFRILREIILIIVLVLIEVLMLATAGDQKARVVKAGHLDLEIIADGEATMEVFILEIDID